MNRWTFISFLLTACSQRTAAETHPVPSVPAPAPVATPSAPVEEVSAPIPEEEPEKLLTEYRTWFKAGPKADGRVHNIMLGAERLNNLLIPPGDTFSFNLAVGPRTEEGGFEDAPTLFMGEIFPGIGGGMCQVSSTLYAALLFTGIETKERRPHSRPSTYISPGFDATVSYPASCLEKDDPRVCYDLKFTNSLDFYLHIKTEVSPEVDKEEGGVTVQKRSLTVSLFGTGEVPKVTTRWGVWNTQPFKKRYRRVHYWHNARKRLKQAGVPGVEGARYLTLTYPDGHTEERKITSRYQPVPEVWEVGLEWKEETP